MTTLLRENHRRFGNRCAMDLSDLPLHISRDMAKQVLKDLGFKCESIDLVGLARSRVGVSQYKRGAHIHEAPEILDCSSFSQWGVGMNGAYIPRTTIEQAAYAGTEVPYDDIQPGDLVFTNSPGFDFYWRNPSFGIGHVGMAAEKQDKSDAITIIHAHRPDSNHAGGVIEEDFIGSRFHREKRGVRRIFNNPQDTVTIICPPKELTWITHSSTIALMIVKAVEQGVLR